MGKLRVCVAGVGAISDIFIENMQNRFESLEVVACTARNMDHIKAKAEKYHIKPMTMDEMFADDSIDMLVNLTPVSAHYDIIKRALMSGKHVFTEKALAMNYQEAKELTELAVAKGLRLGCTPDTFLGSAVQTATEAVNEGRIGTVTGFTIVLNRGLDIFYDLIGYMLKPGGGIGYDFGVYALTAVLSILGPAEEICGFSQTNRPVRKHKAPQFANYGEEYTIQSENIMSASVRMKNGILGTLMFNGDTVFPEKPFIMLMGTKGILYLPDPNQFGGEVVITEGMQRISDFEKGIRESVLPVHHAFSDNSRGVGAADMAKAIEEGCPHRASAEMATHVLEILDGIGESCHSKKYIQLQSTFDLPMPLTGEEIF